MDQLKDFLRLCLNYRFWIAFGVSMILPMAGYFVGSGALVKATTDRVGEINGAKNDIGKYTSPGIVNAQYQPLAAAKKDSLVQDVDATWRKLFATQEPLLKWPTEVEEKFRKWGRKYPADIDQNQVQSTIIDYAIAYPEFVNKLYGIFKPFNFEDGTGIVVAPAPNALLTPAPFTQDSPPELGKVWAEQERIWVVTALLDVVAKVNEGVKAKSWEEAVIKQINLLEVGAPGDQDQKSMVKGEALVPAEVLAPAGSTAVAAPAAPAAPGMDRDAMASMMSGGGGAGVKQDNVYYLNTTSPQYKTLPVKMTVLVDQARLPNFLVGLENSPMAIQVMEIEITKPLTPVSKPVSGERNAYGAGSMGMGSGRMGATGMGAADEGNAGMRPMGGLGQDPRAAGGPGGRGSAGNMGSEMMMGGPGSGAAQAKGGVSLRGTNKAAERKKNDKAAKAKVEPKNKIDQYYNVIEVTVYGQARFYLAPPAPPEVAPSTAPASPTPTPTPTPAPAPEAGKDQPTAPQAEAPAPGDAPKGDATPKPEPAPSADPAKAEAPKSDATSPKLP